MKSLGCLFLVCAYVWKFVGSKDYYGGGCVCGSGLCACVTKMIQGRLNDSGVWERCVRSW